MRLASQGPTGGLDALRGPFDAILGARLTADDRRPVAIAFSGGGDSLALLLLARAWADAHRRPLIALTVDHRLRPEGAAWARWCAARAARLGVDHRTLAWDGDKPTAGLAATARLARHRLLANAARAADAAVILMGHTADDLAEAGAMRDEGSSVPSPRAWSPSPVWPDGRGIFLLRPLLAVRRAELRAALAAAGEAWIDDPANVDLASARARARGRLAGTIELDAAAAPRIAAVDMSGVDEGPAADLRFPRAALEGGPSGRADLGAGLLCAAGTDRPPRGDRLTRLLDLLRTGAPFRATLAGARVECDATVVRLVRDITDHRRGTAADAALPPREAMVWDGRIELTAMAPGAWVGALAGRASRLPSELARRLAPLAPPVRAALPLVILADGRLCLPTLCADGDIEARTLARARLAAARGAILNEEALRLSANAGRAAWRKSRIHPKYRD